jgi:hypothetical protein
LGGEVSSEGMFGDNEGTCVADEREENYDIAIHAVE